MTMDVWSSAQAVWFIVPHACPQSTVHAHSARSWHQTPGWVDALPGAVWRVQSWGVAGAMAETVATFEVKCPCIRLSRLIEPYLCLPLLFIRYCVVLHIQNSKSLTRSDLTVLYCLVKHLSLSMLPLGSNTARTSCNVTMYQSHHLWHCLARY